MKRFMLVVAGVLLGACCLGFAACSGSSGLSASSGSSGAAASPDASESTEAPASTSAEAVEDEEPAASEETLQQLRELAEQANEIDSNSYTNDSYAEVLKYGTIAYMLLDEEDVSEAEAQEAIKNLRDSLDALEEKPAPIEISGNGDDIVDIPDGYEACLVHAEYDSSGNFAIWSCDESMDHTDLLVNTIGYYSGTTTTALGKAEAKYLEVSADGPWTITLSLLADMPTLESGEWYYGDMIGRIDSSSSKLSIENQGEGNFVVRGVDSDGKVKLLVNEIGSYSGTVANRGYFMVIVESEGDWCISW